jgi:hypothetical protein
MLLNCVFCIQDRWYRFQGEAGQRLADISQPPSWEECGTSRVGWLSGAHPQIRWVRGGSQGHTHRSVGGEGGLRDTPSDRSGTAAASQGNSHRSDGGGGGWDDPQEQTLTSGTGRGRGVGVGVVLCGNNRRSDTQGGGDVDGS